MTTIHITGAGGVIDNEVIIIAHTLRELGYKVEVQNETDEGKEHEPDVFRQIVEHVKKFNSGGFDSDDLKCGPLSVLIKTTHIPWGG